MNAGAVLIIYCGEKKTSTAMAVAAVAAPTALLKQFENATYQVYCDPRFNM
jgi:hypothetical protein